MPDRETASQFVFFAEGSAKYWLAAVCVRFSPLFPAGTDTEQAVALPLRQHKDVCVPLAPSVSPLSFEKGVGRQQGLYILVLNKGSPTY